MPLRRPDIEGFYVVVDVRGFRCGIWGVGARDLVRQLRDEAGEIVSLRSTAKRCTKCKTLPAAWADGLCDQCWAPESPCW